MISEYAISGIFFPRKIRTVAVPHPDHLRNPFRLVKKKKSVSKTDCNHYCNRELKKNYEWLKEADKFALTNAIYNMDKNKYLEPKFSTSLYPVIKYLHKKYGTGGSTISNLSMLS